MDAKNGLEHSLYSFKAAVEDDKNKDKLTADEKSDALAKVADVETWLTTNSTAEKEEIDQKTSEFRESVAPFAQKLGLGGEAGAGAGATDKD